MGDGRAEGSSAIGYVGQAAISLMPDVDGTSSGSLLDSILSTFLKKTIQCCLGSSSFFLVVDDIVALDCILNGCCNLRALFYLQVPCLKTNSAASKKENPLTIDCIVNLFGSSVTYPSCCLFILCLGLQFLVLLSSTIYITTAFMLASRHPGLEIKILYYCTLYSTVQ